ncbi:hypothetical protein [Bradyrhizobium sp. RDI18]|uniref:hypothetical protein n=1 Tax=Bradyrhizobium sp. RDI18 TaxID=3367400 RepID=UPI003715FAA2
MLSRKYHISGKSMRSTTIPGAGRASLQPNKKAGARPAFSMLVESDDQYLAITANKKAGVKPAFP